MSQQISEQQWIDMGTRAQELLSNEVFGMAVKDVVDYHLNAFINSKPEDTKLRESAYYQATAVQQVIAVLQQWVAIKENIKANLNQVEE